MYKDIQNPYTKHWRCWSTSKNAWASGWLTEEEYIKNYGFPKPSKFISYEKIVFNELLNKSTFDKNITFETYKQNGDDYLHMYNSDGSVINIE